MSVLLLRLSGPMQSWGDSSRFVRRATRNEPTKSGVIGLMAAALGRSREVGIEDLAALEFGVRDDQPGSLVVDFQTEKTLGGSGKSMPLSYRYYLSDAKFLAALAGNDALIESIDEALKHPCWPLFLGRRSCPLMDQYRLACMRNIKGSGMLSEKLPGLHLRPIGIGILV